MQSALKEHVIAPLGTRHEPSTVPLDKRPLQLSDMPAADPEPEKLAPLIDPLNRDPSSHVTLREHPD